MRKGPGQYPANATRLETRVQSRGTCHARIGPSDLSTQERRSLPAAREAHKRKSPPKRDSASGLRLELEPSHLKDAFRWRPGFLRLLRGEVFAE